MERLTELINNKEEGVIAECTRDNFKEVWNLLTLSKDLRWNWNLFVQDMQASPILIELVTHKNSMSRMVESVDWDYPKSLCKYA